MTQRREQINRNRRSSTEGLYSRGVVRTRGFVPVSPPSETEGAPIRTRGAVRTRGPAVEVEPWQELNREELGELLEELRDAQDGFPITIVVENVQDSRAQKFLDCLHQGNLLGADDALWIVGEGQYENVVPERFRREDFIPEDAYLNVQEQGDKAVIDILTPELVFVADADAEKLKERLEKWERRVLAIIVAGPDDFDPSTFDLMLGIPGEEGDHWRRRWPKE